VVLSDILTAAAEGAGKLVSIFARFGDEDRDPPRAMRPALTLPGRKLFVAAELFTVGCGELPAAPFATGGITLETVSGDESLVDSFTN
jgi:hypothetical protein